MKVNEEKLNEINSHIEENEMSDKNEIASYLISQGFQFSEIEYIIRKLKISSRENKISNNELMVNFFFENENHSKENFQNYLNNHLDDEEKSKKYKSSYYNILKYMYDKKIES